MDSDKAQGYPFGNEYHTTADAETKILFHIEIVEGKDQPSSGPHSVKEFDDELKSKMAGLVVRMTKQIWNSGEVVALDSGFGSIPTVTELSKKGLFSTCVIKKKKH